ncbi:hypothetical protein MMC25_002934 [Agyrium rufum]|nr:hypothetical protein [Agyrium rufum]
MSTTNSKSSIAVFGATGGCTAAALVLALNNKYYCTALVRTPSKLTSLLLSRGVSQSTIDTYLHVVHGDARDVKAVQTALLAHPSLQGRISTDRPILVDRIVSGIGSTVSLTGPFDGKICRDAAQTLQQALAGFSDSSTNETGWSSIPKTAGGKRPYLIYISTTGITTPSEPKDLTRLATPFYHYALAKPHKDKRVMEAIHAETVSQGLADGFTAVRPSFLTDGKEWGVNRVRAGTVRKPAIGYTISRLDVGRWIFEKLIVEDHEGHWAGEKVTITY